MPFLRPGDPRGIRLGDREPAGAEGAEGTKSGERGIMPVSSDLTHTDFDPSASMIWSRARVESGQESGAGPRPSAFSAFRP